jgi:hypothetical protein
MASESAASQAVLLLNKSARNEMHDVLYALLSGIKPWLAALLLAMRRRTMTRRAPRYIMNYREIRTMEV